MILDAVKREKILLSGASGMLGSAIGAALSHRGASLLRLVRHPENGPDELRWDPAARKIDPGRLEGITAAVHLSGASVASKRWTAQYKREMTESRVQTTRLLAETLAKLKQPPQVLVKASAVGFYGDRGDEILDEDSAAGKGFFPELCAAWEAAAQPAEDAGIRVVQLRFGIVLGRGREWMSWVSEADAVRTALFALDHPDISGPVNVVAPQPSTNTDFTREMGRAVHRPAILPAPAFALRLVFGEMADEALLASTRVVPKRLTQAGFVFNYPTLSEAFAAALQK